MSDTVAEDPKVFLQRVHALAAQALTRWDLEVVSIAPIKVRENAVFRVDLKDGGKVALRVHRRGYHSNASLASEFAWMRVLKLAGIEVPEVIVSSQGRDFEVVEIEGLPGARQVDVFHWISGRQLGSSEAGLSGSAAIIAAQYETIGRIMARVHNHAATWQRPAGFTRHAWDIEGLLGEQPLWGRFWELPALSPAQRALLLRTRALARQVLEDYGQGADRFGLIHADLCPENVLVDGGTVRLIDFDDAGFGWHLFDIATSLYFITSDSQYPVARDALLRGYRRERPLDDAAIVRLPYFMAARATTYLGWVHTRPGTQTALELTPFLVELACATAEECGNYAGRSGGLLGNV